MRAGLWVTHNGLSELSYTWNYAAALKHASATTGCVLEEKDKLPLTAAGAAQLESRIKSALRVGCSITMLYAAEIHAATLGSPTFSLDWQTALQLAHTELG